jgi:AraC-like DNA-binding protein
MPRRCEIQQTFEVPGVAVDVVAFAWSEPMESVFHAHDVAMLDMCLTPRPSAARGRYEGIHGSRGFEPLGEIIFVPRDVPMRGRSAEGTQTSLRVRFGSDTLARASEGAEPIWQGRSPNVDAPAVRGNCRRILKELHQPGFAAAIVIESAAQMMAVDIARHSRETATTASRGGLGLWRKRVIEERIACDGPPPSVAELADLCKLSERHLMRAFLADTGRTVAAYIAGERIDRAKRLLACSARPIKAIAADVGFSHGSTFATAFRGAVGISPRDYRIQFRS